MTPPKTILFITSCPLAWGGSEELWAGAALQLRQRGHRVIAGRSQPVAHWRQHPKWAALRQAGIEVGAFGVPAFFRALPDACQRYAPPLAPFCFSLRNRALALAMRRLGVDLVVISQGNTFDGMDWVDLPLIARSAKKPYALVCQKNTEADWPLDVVCTRAKEHFRLAAGAFFVSQHNLTLAENMLGLELENAEVVRNPFLIQTSQPLPWPEPAAGVFQLACVGRLWPREKGQDLLLAVLALEKWRSRPLQVNFFGEGPMAESLASLAAHHRLTNVRFCGFSSDITEVWKTHHALVLPSRAEGLPLAQVEAMICGRPAIMTPAGGAGEIVEDGVTGFMAHAITAEALDDALERAWQRRHEWRDIGLRAAASIRHHFPPDPGAAFADKLEALLGSKI